MAQAQLDFCCDVDKCDGVVVFELADASNSASCPICGKKYILDDSAINRIDRMNSLIFAIRNTEDILTDSYVSVTVAAGSVKVPYALLLSRMNSNIHLMIGGKDTECRLWLDNLN